MLTNDGCPRNMLAIKDALEVVDGKWKLLILIALSEENRRFTEIARELPGISDKMLSKELKALEVNRLIERTVSDESSTAVEYSITPHGRSLERVMKELYNWGMDHRKEIIGE